jgi:PEP-CTERM motif
MTEHGGSVPTKKLSWVRSVLLLAGLALGSLPASGRADSTLLFENFDELAPKLAVKTAGLFHTLYGTNVDVVGGSNFGYLCAAPESGSCVDTNGSDLNYQGVLQSIPMTLYPGNTYDLSFDLIGSQRGVTASTTVTFGTYDHTFTLAPNDDTSGIVSQAVIKVTSITQTYLTFTSDTDSMIGNLLDNVLITDPPGPVPEPATLALFATALFGVARARRKHASV